MRRAEQEEDVKDDGCEESKSRDVDSFLVSAARTKLLHGTVVTLSSCHYII